MDLNAQIFAYCERGRDPSFWAEPVNALTNIAFILMAAVAWRELAARAPGEAKAFRYFLIINVGAIGVGSFLFHTFAVFWTSIADVAPIAVFMLCYLAFALRRFVGLHPLLIPPLVAGFAYCVERAMRLQCWQGEIGFSLTMRILPDSGCLNGSVAYMPALALMLAVGALMAMRRHPATPYVLAAAVVFMLSVTFRTVDRIWCHDVMLGAKALGTHFLWHMLNSIALFLLLLAVIRHGTREAAVPAPA